MDLGEKKDLIYRVKDWVEEKGGGRSGRDWKELDQEGSRLDRLA